MLARGTPEEIKAHSYFETILLGRMTPSTFASWVYAHSDLARIIGYADEEDLLSFDYQANNNLAALRRLLRDIYQRWWPGPESVRVIWRSEVVELAEYTLQQAISLPRAARLMTKLATDQFDTYEHGYLFQPFWDFYAEYMYLAIIGDETDTSQTVGSQSANKLAQLESEHRSPIEEACRQILDVFGTL